eukprot:Tbor_TRINITY_DN433_c0_g1::TRINITY_DN433_c0_g1_i2::g.3187::m.3187
MEAPIYHTTVPTLQRNDDISIDDVALKSANLESSAEAVMHANQLLVDLDRRKNQIREGIRALKNEEKEVSEQRAQLMELSKELLLGVSDMKGTNNGNTEAQRRKNIIRELVGIPTSCGATASHTCSLAHHTVGKKRDSEKMWLLCSGGVFMETSKSAAMKKLLKDQYNTDQLIDATRDDLKRLVVELAHHEGPDSALARLNKGFELKGMR